MAHSQMKVFFTVLFCLLNFCCVSQKKDGSWFVQNAPFAMETPVVPAFPNREFSIEKFGAVGDGNTLNTAAFDAAIDACSKSGGGKVVVPPGLWMTGPIQLKSNVNLVVERGALVQMTGDHTKYPIIKASDKSNNYVVASPVYGYGLENIAITGEGVIDGVGETWRPVKKEKTTAAQWKKFTSSGGVLSNNESIWWPTKEAFEGEQYLRELHKKNKKPSADDLLPARDYLRPYMVYFVNCKNVLLDGVTIRNSPKFVFYPNSCTDVTIRHVNIFNEWWAQNGDGIDISRCKNVLIYGCNVSAGDDGICMKSSRSSSDKGEAALRNVVIADCVVYHAHGGFVIGSNTDGGMENIFVTNCDFIGSDIGARMKSNIGRGGLVKNIFLKNIFMKDIVNEAISFSTSYEDVPAGKKGGNSAPAKNEKIPRFVNFHFDSIYCNGANQAVAIEGLKEAPIDSIYFKNIFISAQQGFTATEATNLLLDNVRIDARESPLFQLNHVTNVHIRGAGSAEARRSIRADNTSAGIEIEK